MRWVIGGVHNVELSAELGAAGREGVRLNGVSCCAKRDRLAALVIEVRPGSGVISRRSCGAAAAVRLEVGVLEGSYGVWLQEAGRLNWAVQPEGSGKLVFRKRKHPREIKFGG